jgi:capsule polysaccharide export protein KpsE/RkpR
MSELDNLLAELDANLTSVKSDDDKNNNEINQLSNTVDVMKQTLLQAQ